MGSKFYDYMIDVETTGTNASKHAMIQLAAVRFNLEEATIDTETMFDRCLLMPENREWDHSTYNWWTRQIKVLEDIQARAEDPALVMKGFVDWIGYQSDKPIRFWAKPTTFDWWFVNSYLEQFNLVSPFHYRWACDVNSFTRGLFRDSTLEHHLIEFQGDKHNALHDVINQIGTLFDAVEKTNGSN